MKRDEWVGTPDETMISETEESSMDDMQFAKYTWEIREVLENVSEENLKTLVRNAAAYAISNNRSKTNWIAQELFVDVIPDELIAELFNEE